MAKATKPSNGVAPNRIRELSKSACAVQGTNMIQHCLVTKGASKLGEAVTAGDVGWSSPKFMS